MFNIPGLEEATSITNPFLKIAIVGPPGIGKSWLAATAPKPVWDLDFDGRAASLKGKEGVVVKTYVDIDPNNPKAMAQVETDLNVLEYEKQKGNPIPATFVLDSLTYMRKACENELMKQQSSLSRSLKIGPRTIRISSGWDIINGNRAYIEYVIGRLSALGNVIVICHVQDEKDNVKSTKEQKAYTGRVTIQPQYMETILSLFDDVWLIEVDWQGKRKVQTGITTEFVAKRSLLLDDLEDPDIEAMLKKHKSRLPVVK